ncbi:MAG: MotA/TolQ/ExbB proton channel family protein [Myxococcota bacterium]
MDPVTQVFLAVVTEAAPAHNLSMLALITDADIIVQLVLFILLGMSVGCWVIIVNKIRLLQHAADRTDAFTQFFYNARNIREAYDSINQFKGSPLADIFLRGFTDNEKLRKIGTENAILGSADYIERSLRRVVADKRTELERFTIFLATTGSTAPFIGLFGTVWGILRAFQKIGATGQASIQTVGPDIAHALIATAVGLAAAIPAVIGFNFINRKIRVLANEMENFSADFINIIKRSYLKR